EVIPSPQGNDDGQRSRICRHLLNVYQPTPIGKGQINAGTTETRPHPVRKAYMGISFLWLYVYLTGLRSAQESRNAFVAGVVSWRAVRPGLTPHPLRMSRPGSISAPLRRRRRMSARPTRLTAPRHCRRDVAWVTARHRVS